MKKKDKRVFTHKILKGLKPGALVYYGENKPEDTIVTFYKIRQEVMETLSGVYSKEYFPIVDVGYVLWVRVIGLKDISMLHSICEAYGIENMTLEDILHTSDSSKFEYFENYGFAILKKVLFVNGEDNISTKQISMVLSKNILITFEEKVTEEVDIIVGRVSKKPDVFLGKGSSYLAYVLIDTIVDDYLDVLDKIQFEVEELEDTMVITNNPVATDKMFAVKRLLNLFYRNTRTVDEIVDKLMKYLSFNDDNTVSITYLKDLYDHAINVREEINGCRETLNAIYDENISRMQLRTSYFINVLTVVNVLLWPFVIISGIFGMNFEHLPFNSARYGFFISIGVMIIISIVLLIFFKKKKFI